MGIDFKNVTINNATVNSIIISTWEQMRTSNVSLRVLQNVLHYNALIPRLTGKNQIASNCTPVLNDRIQLYGYIGEITIYDEGYVTFSYEHDSSKKKYSTRLDLFQGKFTRLCDDKDLRIYSVNDFLDIQAYKVIEHFIAQQIEVNRIGKEIKRTDYITEFEDKDAYDLYIREGQCTDLHLEIKRFFYSELSNLSEKQQQVISMLLENPDATQKELAARIGISGASLTEMKKRAFHCLQMSWNKKYPNENVPVQDISKYQKTNRKGPREL